MRRTPEQFSDSQQGFERPAAAQRAQVEDPAKRRTLQLIRQALAVGGFLAASGSILGYLIYRAEKGPKVLDGQPLEGAEEDYYFTASFGPNLEIPVRTKLDLRDSAIAGFTKAGHLIRATEVYGPVYPTSAGNVVPSKDGRPYGLWYKVGKVPLYQETEEGFVPVLSEAGGSLEARDVFIAANFVRELTTKELQNLPNAK